MNKFEYFLWLVRQGLGHLFRFSDVMSYATFVLIAVIVLVGSWTFLRNKGSVKPQLLWVFSPLLITALIFAMGVFFEGNQLSMSSRSHRLPMLVVYGLLLAHLPAVILLAFRLRAYLWLALSVSALITWFSFWAAFVSNCSIAGDWP